MGEQMDEADEMMKPEAKDLKLMRKALEHLEKSRDYIALAFPPPIGRTNEVAFYFEKEMRLLSGNLRTIIAARERD
jgi:hypothetical protein